MHTADYLEERTFNSAVKKGIKEMRKAGNGSLPQMVTGMLSVLDSIVILKIK